MKVRNSGKSASNLVIKWQIFVPKVKLFCNRKHVYFMVFFLNTGGDFYVTFLFSVSLLTAALC